MTATILIAAVLASDPAPDLAAIERRLAQTVALIDNDIACAEVQRTLGVGIVCPTDRAAEAWRNEKRRSLDIRTQFWDGSDGLLFFESGG